MQIAQRAERFTFERGYEVIAAAHRLEASGRSIVHLDLGEPDFATPENVVEAGVRALRDGHTHYTPAAGLVAARQAVAEHLRRTRGVVVDPDRVVLTGGASQALLLTVLALVEPGSSVILCDPCYPIYPALVQLAGARVTWVPLRSELGFRFDWDEMRSAVDASTRAILINSPHNPTGGVLSGDDLAMLGDLAARHDLHVISDEVYATLVYDGVEAHSALSVPGLSERVTCVDSLSKSHAMCGWRIGYAVAPPEVVRRLEVLMFAGNLCAPSVAQMAAIEALTAPASIEAVDRMRMAFADRRELALGLLERLPRVSCHRPRGAFYLFPDFRGVGLDDRELARRLLVDGGVAGVPGSAFGSRGAGHLRLSYTASREHLREGLRRISGVVDAVLAERVP
jgi:aspartate aminotransferase